MSERSMAAMYRDIRGEDDAQHTADEEQQRRVDNRADEDGARRLTPAVEHGKLTRAHPVVTLGAGRVPRQQRLGRTD